MNESFPKHLVTKTYQTHIASEIAPDEIASSPFLHYMKYFALLLLVATSVRASPESKLIYWGGIAEQQKGEEAGRSRGKDFPFLASLKIRSKRDNSLWMGSGALIADDWIITAKHVASPYLDHSNTFVVEVSFPDGTVRGVRGGFGHPDRDVAIIKLDLPVKHIAPPSLQNSALPSRLGRDGFPVTITGANGSFIAYDVIAYSEDDRLFSPDILRGGDSGAPVLGQDIAGDLIILGTLVGPYRLKNDGQYQFIQNMSYAQFAQVGGLKDWITAKMSSKDGIKWNHFPQEIVPSAWVAAQRGTPEFQLNQAAYLFLGGHPREAKEMASELLPQLEGRMREAIAKELIQRCKQAK